MTGLHILLLLALISTGYSYRLPTIYSPSFYSINLTVPAEVFTTENATSYTGSVAITLTTTQNTSEIVLHASATYLNVSTATVESSSGNVGVSSWSVNSTTDIMTLSLNTSLTAGKTYVVTMAFAGQLSTSDMYGFYKSSYTDSTSNQTVFLVTTQMEAPYARRAIPCFDEPRYKANFTISLTYPTGLSALGNMDVNTTSSTTDTVTTVFNTTPKMSTYLLAFIVSYFTCSSGNSIEERLPYQVCSRNETQSLRNVALEVAPLVIDSLNSYLGINYSLNMNKLDQVAIPDFSAGAMENWGLITYRERGLLYDTNETANSYYQYIASVIAHELAHQWFGNLVTCKWWSEIFLNEGFATFFEFFTSHEIYPELEMDKQFVIKSLQYSFEEDANTQETLRDNATTPGEISARFGTLSYDKGGSVLRMVEHMVGTDVWKAALNVYLNTYAHSTAEPDDLWEIIGTNATNLPTTMSSLMHTWIEHAGYPIVNVTLNGSQLNFFQKRFVFKNMTDTTTWFIPITYTTSEHDPSNFLNTTPSAWLNRTSSLTLNVSSFNWVVINNLQTGYYRVNYDAALWSRLAIALQQSNFSGVPEINRAQIVNDAFSLARGGYITYSQVFTITQFLSKETSYTVWYAALDGFGYLLNRIGTDDTLGAAIANHALSFLSTVLETVPISSTNSSNHIYTLKQVLAQTWACQLGSSNCTSSAISLFQQYKNSSARPEKNLRSIVYCYGLKHSSSISSDWQFLWNAFLNTTLSTEQVTILAALGCPDNSTILTSYLEKTLSSDSGIRSQDYTSVFSAVYRGSSTGVDVALDFFTNNYNAIITRYSSFTGVGSILKGIAARITTNSQMIKLQNLLSSNMLNGTILEAANTAYTTAQNNNEWVQTYKNSIASYYGLEVESTTGSNTGSSSSAFRSCFSLGFLMAAFIVAVLC